MTEQFDPYAILGVETDASTADIRRAYRRRSKSAHPDQGGERAQWDRLARAHRLLADEPRRARFDQTGRMDEENPDLDRQQAFAVIAEQVVAFTNDFVNSNFDPSRDPRRFPVLDRVRAHLNSEIAGADRALKTGRSHLKFMQDYAKRFSRKQNAKGLDQVAAILHERIGHIENQIIQVEDVLRVRRLALDVLAEYDFANDQPKRSAVW